MTQPATQVTVLSPHFDDVPLSLGESLSSGWLAQCEVRVRVVFGRSNWTTRLHPTPSRATAVSWWRRAEEQLASMHFGYRYTYAGWEEAILRWGGMDTERMLDVDSDPDSEPVMAEVGAWLEDVVGRIGPSSVLLSPAGLGGHVDHRIVAAAAARLAGSSGALIGFYEDRPYSAYLDPDQRRAQLPVPAEAYEPVAVSGPVRTRTQWAARVFYPSQMSPYFRDAMELDRATRSHETVWFPRGRIPATFWTPV